VDVIAEITVEEQDGIIVADFMVATTVVAIIVDLDTTEDMVVEIISPTTPYMNKPIDSSVLSLLDIALSQKPEKLFRKRSK